MTKKSILIVDDVVEYVQSLVRALSLDYDIAKAFTLEEAKKSMNNTTPQEGPDGLSLKIVQDLLANIREIKVKLVMTILLIERNVAQVLKVTNRVKGIIVQTILSSFSTLKMEEAWGE